MSKALNMTGWVMSEHGVPDSKITVLYRAENYVSPNGKKMSQWVCQCECGSEPFISVGGDVKSGKTKSCGCLRDQANKEKFKKYNNYELYEEYGVGWTFNTNEIFYFDREDYDKIKDYCWIAGSTTRKYRHLYTHIDNSKKSIDMHIFLGFKGYDHKDRNPLNNRKGNLRKCTHQENSRNRSMASNNTSGVTGVCWRQRESKWFAYISIDRKQNGLGYFSNKQDAIVARLNAEKQYFGEFSPQRHLFEEYGIK